VKGEPIVENPEDALKMFLSTEIDFLVIENFLITKDKIHSDFEFNYDKMIELQNKYLSNNKNYNKRIEIYL
jgi:hypothetical protein